jgi:hypothetical protein
LVHVDTERSRELVNRQQFYVSISRARTDAQVFTNDREGLALAVQRDVQKATALDAVRESQGNLAQLRGQGGEHDRARQSFTTREIPAMPAQEWRHERVQGKEHAVTVRAPVEWRHDQVLQREREAEQAQEHRREPARQPEVQQKREEQRIERGYSRGLGRGR